MAPVPAENFLQSHTAATLGMSNTLKASDFLRSDAKTSHPSLERQFSDGYAWDIFREAGVKTWHSFSYYLRAAHTWAWQSLLSLVFLMCLVVSLVCSKASLLLATSSMTPGTSAYTCRHGEHGNTCMAVPRHWQSSLDLYCLPPLTDKDSSHDVIRIGAHESATWALSALLMMLLPHVISSVVQLGLCCLHPSGFPRFSTVLYFLLVDTLRITGTFILLFYTLPAMEDSSLAFLLLSTLYLYPMVASMLMASPQLGSSTFSLLAIMTHVACIVIWIFHFSSAATSILIPASLAALGLVSLGSYLDSRRSRRFSSVSGLPLYTDNKHKHGEGNSKLVFIRNIWSIVIIVLTGLVLAQEKYNFNQGSPTDHIQEIVSSFWSTGAVYVILTNFISGTVILVSVKVLRRLSVESWLIAVAVLISLMAGFVGLYGLSNAWSADPCMFSNVVKPRVFWNAWFGPSSGFWWTGCGWLFVPWWIALWWFHRDVITAEGHRHDMPYSELPWAAAFPEMPLMKSKSNMTVHYDQIPHDSEEGDKMAEAKVGDKSSNSWPFIYACVTMWHETEAEMMNILQSLYRMDVDQHDKQEEYHKGTACNGFYEFEAHIFFDDAFEGRNRTANQFVRKLISVAHDAASRIYGEGIRLRLPVRMGTPYGARLVWYLPGGNRLVAHLKDKELIRHGKRWSQVMYMYYLLTQKLKRGGDADNTFILTLDGDVQFQPGSVRRLLQQIRRSVDIGSVCGRVHPTGSGPWVWYQRFEYAAAHWIQKSTEHVLGSVLCSPGCFSIVRTSALMTDGVVRVFTSMPSEARHFLQYDQGEDRWLCTLLMQQGFIVQYSSDSHVTTCAPTSFDEFFNQRRRWTPASIVNNFDLLLNWNSHPNNCINTIYMYYLVIQLVCSLFGTCAIFILCIRALSLAGDDKLSYNQSAVINLVLVGIFIVVCYTCNSKMQVRVAAVLSIYYALIQFLVVCGMVGHLWQGTFCTPESIFLLAMTGVVALCALAHPAEAWVVMHFLVYFMAIPATFMLLMIYTVANMHSVKWGTREAKSGPDSSSDTGAHNRQRRRSISRRHSITMPVIPEESLAVLSDIYQDQLVSPLSPDHSVILTDDLVKEIPGASDISLRACIDESSLGCGPVAALDQSESLFFNELIERYLFPIDGDRHHQRQCEQQLKGLRNQCSLFFYLVNGITFALSYWRREAMDGIMSRDLCGDVAYVDMTTAFLVLVFGFLTTLQLVCMVIHRFSTLRLAISRCVSFNEIRLRKMFRKVKRSLGSHAHSHTSPAHDVRCVGVEQGLMKRSNLWEEQRYYQVDNVEGIHEKCR